MNDGYYARFDDSGRGQLLEAHLNGVAALASKFAAQFNAAEWGQLAGLWHDLGKYRPEFQRRVRGEDIRAEHSGAGAVHAKERMQNKGIPLAFAIAGHHAGLSNLSKEAQGKTPLMKRLENNNLVYKALLNTIPAQFLNMPLPELPECLNRLPEESPEQNRRHMEFWIRFLFSTLVDADWLDTEQFMNPARTAARSGYEELPSLCKRLEQHIDSLAATHSAQQQVSRLNRIRAEILSSCRTSAEQTPGLFSLTAPTGSGKTLSAMNFALRHATQHGLRRVIVVIPYTSIIEQNAQVYREALGSENVLEHHSNLDIERRNETLGDEISQKHDLASENWDAPVIVTTSVQFFESLHTNARGQCRKLHNIAKSVIIFDECQTFPPGFLLAILDALNELQKNYGCSIVLSTATQPALEARQSLPQGLKAVREIISQPALLMAQLSRVTYHWPKLDDPPSAWDDIAAQMAEESQVLAVVHRRKDARELAVTLQAMLPDESVYHLSALMCPRHRLDVIDHVRNAGHPCKLVSTQLIEAGVDLDFPVVLRAMAGLDSIVQAAGRCNREGRLASGKVIVFKGPTEPPPGSLKRGTDITATLLTAANGTLEPNTPAVFEQYFKVFYNATNLDDKQVMRERQEFNFVEVANTFKLIEDGHTVAVVTPYGKAPGICQEIQQKGISRELRRKLQPYLVQINKRDLDAWVQDGALSALDENLWILGDLYASRYDIRYGLDIHREQGPNPEALVI